MPIIFPLPVEASVLNCFGSMFLQSILGEEPATKDIVKAQPLDYNPKDE